MESNSYENLDEFQFDMFFSHFSDWQFVIGNGP